MATEIRTLREIDRDLTEARKILHETPQDDTDQIEAYWDLIDELLLERYRFTQALMLEEALK